MNRVMNPGVMRGCRLVVIGHRVVIGLMGLVIRLVMRLMVIGHRMVIGLMGLVMRWAVGCMRLMLRRVIGCMRLVLRRVIGLMMGHVMRLVVIGLNRMVIGRSRHGSVVVIHVGVVVGHVVRGVRFLKKLAGFRYEICG